MVINTALAYPFYVAPVVFPAKRWLGSGAGPGGLEPDRVARNHHLWKKAGAKYGPGILTTLLLHLPIGIGYLSAVDHEGPISKRDWARGSIGAVVSAIFGVIVLRSDSSKHADARPQQPLHVHA